MMSRDEPIDRRGVSLTDDLVVGRQCGGCVACCKLFHVPQLQKPPNVLCSHCTGRGCGIHEVRPEVCRTYYCLWPRIEAMPDFARPDKLGIVFSIVRGF